MPECFVFPAKYKRVVESSLALLGADIGRDQKFRGDEDERIRKLAHIPDEQIDPSLEGTIVITILPAAMLDDATALPGHLTAFAQPSR